MNKWTSTLALGVLASVLAAWIYEDGIKRGIAPAKAKEEPVKTPVKVEKIRLYLFTASWCGPCRMLHQEMKTPEVQKALERFEVVETEDPSLMQKYNVGGFPTLVALTKTGPAIKVGYLPAAALASWLNSLQ